MGNRFQKSLILIFFIFVSPLIGQSSEFKIFYYMDNSKGNPTPITIELPYRIEDFWEIPNMSGNWSCTLMRRNFSNEMRLTVWCWEDGVQKVLFKVSCSEKNKTNDFEIDFMGDFQQTMTFSCRY